MTNRLKREIASDNMTAQDIIRLIDTQGYFDLMKLPYPRNRDAVLEKLQSEKLIVSGSSGYKITNLGALLFAKNLNEFQTLFRKAVRVIVYKGKNKLETIKDINGT